MRASLSASSSQQSPFQFGTKPKLHDQIQIEAEVSQKTEKVLTRQKQNPKNFSPNAESQESPRSANTATYEHQQAEDPTFEEEATSPGFSINRYQQGKSSRINFFLSDFQEEKIKFTTLLEIRNTEISI